MDPLFYRILMQEIELFRRFYMLEPSWEQIAKCIENAQSKWERQKTVNAPINRY